MTAAVASQEDSRNAGWMSGRKVTASHTTGAVATIAGRPCPSADTSSRQGTLAVHDDRRAPEASMCGLPAYPAPVSLEGAGNVEGTAPTGAAMGAVSGGCTWPHTRQVRSPTLASNAAIALFSC